MESKEIKKNISLALEAVEEMQDKELKAVAFGVVLEQMLITSLPGQNKVHTPSEAPPRNDAAPSLSPTVRMSPALSSLPITQEQLSEIYEVNGDELRLRVKVNDVKNSEQQRKLAQAMLFGYKVLLDEKDVKGSKLLMTAKEWDIPTDHFVKNIKGNKKNPNKYVDIRNTGKGKDPIFSLRPGALNKLVDEVKALAS